MKNKIRAVCNLVCAISICVIAGFTPEIKAQDGNSVAIVNPAVGSLSKAQVQQIFRGIIKQVNGTEVKVLFNADDAVNNAFAQKYLGMSGSAMESLWINIKIRDGIQIPRKVSAAVARSLVAGSAVFIGIVNRSDAGAGVTIIE